MELVSQPTTLWNLLDDGRRILANQLEALYPEDVAGFLRGLLLGEREKVPVDIEENYSTLGIVHLLSISGLHVSIWITCLFAILTWIGVTREKAAFSILLLLPFYVLLTGADPPVVRSAIMASLTMVALILRRFRDSLSFLAVALLIQLGWNPYQWLEAGFQLSFVLTFALLAAVKPLSQVLPLMSSCLRGALAATLVAEAVSFPIIIYHFYEYSILSGLANLILVPIYSGIILPGSFLSLVVSFIFDPIGEVLAAMITQAIIWIHSVV